MAVIRLKPYNPWWHFYGDIPQDTSTTVSGLPANTDLHIYTKGYREHEIRHTDANGTLTFTYPSRPGKQIIIQEKPSTKHIYIGGFINPKGGDCSSIGTWNATTITCTLNQDVNEMISIEDDGITLDGNKKTITSATNGIYTDQSNVTIKNITVATVDRGIVFANTAFFFPPVGGLLTDAVLNDNANQVVIQDVANVSLNRVTINRGSTAIRLTDQGGYQLFNTTITGSALGINFDNSKGAVALHLTIKNGSTGITGNDTGGVTLTQSNMISNAVDIGPFSGTLTLSAGVSRGNFWDKNTACIQDSNNPSHCTNSYTTGGHTDTLPWACENGWTKTCPIKPPTGSPTPTPTPTATPTGSVTPTPVSGGGDWGEILNKNGPTTTLFDDLNFNVKLKELPNGWAVEILQESGALSKIRDPIDDTEGWVNTADVKKATNASETKLFQDRGEVIFGTTSERYGVVKKALELYTTTTSTTPHLYNWQSQYTGDAIPEKKFLPEVLIALASRESGGGYDNSIVTADFGHGIKQLTVGPVRRDISYLYNVLKGESLYSATIQTFETFGTTGEAAVALFQTKYSITGDKSGQVSTNTISKLNQLLVVDATAIPRKYPNVPTYFRFANYMKANAVNHADHSSPYDNRGAFTKLSIYPCNNTTDYLSNENLRHCYSGIVPKAYAPQPNYGNKTFRYYNNSEQSIYANIKDGLLILTNAYARYKDMITAKYGADTTNIFKDAGTGTTVTAGDLKVIVAMKGYNGFGGNPKCPGTTIAKYPLTSEPSYIKAISDKLKDSAVDYPDATAALNFAKKLDLAVVNKTTAALCSPAYLQVWNAGKQMTGFNGSVVKYQLYNVAYDDIVHESAETYFPTEDYYYRVVGKADGTYRMYVEDVRGGNGVVFSAADIPTSKCAIHEYRFDWSTLRRGSKGAEIMIDDNCDGVFETTIKSDLALSAEEYTEANGKILICHVPPGNPANGHTLSVSKSALPAHLKHDDYEGKCKDGRKNDDEKKGKDGENKDDEDNEKDKNKDKDHKSNDDTRKEEKQSDKKEISGGNNKKGGKK